MLSRIFAAFIVLGTGQLSSAADEKPSPVSETIRQAWLKKLITSGWIRHNEGGFLSFSESKDGEAGDLPAFRVALPEPGALLDLPEPDQDFGLLIFPPAVPGQEFKLGSNDFKAMAGMSRLTTLLASNTLFPDDALKELAGNKKLRELYLIQANLTDESIKHLAALTELRSLSLNDNLKLTSEAMKTVGKLKELRWLSLGHTAVTSLKDLAALEHLETLFLPGTKIPDEALEELTKFKKLKALYMSGSTITDSGLKHLALLKELRVLQLNSTSVTDAGLKELKSLKNLRKLTLMKTKVTADGIKKLKEVLPELKVEH